MIGLALALIVAAGAAAGYFGGRRRAKSASAVFAEDALGEELRLLHVQLAQANDAMRSKVDVDALTSTADRLRLQERKLAGLLAGQDRKLLVMKLAAAHEAGASGAELDALGSHLASLDATQADLDETIARLRSLLHGVASLRSDIALAGIDSALIDDSCARLARLREELTPSEASLPPTRRSLTERT